MRRSVRQDSYNPFRNGRVTPVFKVPVFRKGMWYCLEANRGGRAEQVKIVAV